MYLCYVLNEWKLCCFLRFYLLRKCKQYTDMKLFGIWFKSKRGGKTKIEMLNFIFLGFLEIGRLFGFYLLAE